MKPDAIRADYLKCIEQGVRVAQKAADAGNLGAVQIALSMALVQVREVQRV